MDFPICNIDNHQTRLKIWEHYRKDRFFSRSVPTVPKSDRHDFNGHHLRIFEALATAAVGLERLGLNFREELYIREKYGAFLVDLA